MPFSTPHVLLSVEGSFLSTPSSDIWRATFKFPVSAGSPPTAASILSFLTAVSGPIGTFHRDSTLNTGNSSYIDSLAGAVIGTDGHYLGGGSQETVRYTYPIPVRGNGTTSSPWSQALVLTLRTAKPRGPASHGRAYWPYTGGGTNPDGLLSTTTCGVLATAAKTLLDAFNAAAAASGFGVAGRVSVCSQVGSGQNLPVVKVGIGRKVDRQERRENNLHEAHTYADLSGAAALRAEAVADGHLWE